MKIKNLKLVCALFITSPTCATAPVLSSPATEIPTEDNISGRAQDEIIITCPAVLVAVFQMPQGWSTFGGGQQKKKFVDAGVDSASSRIQCVYGAAMDEILFRPLPKGYKCEIYRTGSSRPIVIECKRIKPPIKIGGNTK